VITSPASIVVSDVGSVAVTSTKYRIQGWKGWNYIYTFK